ncbi:glycosyltransferase family 2 protein [Thermodesulfovibrio yellowstonii]|uniref:Glycosyltransferase involved in cell wall biogenesis n=1 Tax=Thermodesulfovibrio yellowstonii (strain ATCC 51303 / DSM 11347 / YP87) TaxID=289376 RepID=B5YJB7_THEYD|nr:glycosyltransferase family 2 protein [Thermodesulfovibrio yellowstonii]ACI20752.1 glycosyltransferase involved in cell wall biogenesis [Thermodesulfovibrio yellowstonii DSM 11347]
MKNHFIDESDKPLVSIITPTYNQAKFLAETIESVLKQDYKNIEYIIIDGGSTDGTLDILKKYSDKVFWISEKDKGQVDAINKGLKIAKGSILAYLNSDDTYYTENAVSLAVEYLINNSHIGIVYGKSVYVDEKGQIIGYYNSYEFDYEKIFSECLNPVPQPSTFIKREVFEKIGFFDDKLCYAMDLDFWLRAGLFFQFGYLPEILSTFRLHSESKSVACIAKAAPEIIYIYKKIFRNPNLPNDLKNKEKEIMARVYLYSAEQYFSGNSWKEARKNFIKALRLNVKVLKLKQYIKFIFSLMPIIFKPFWGIIKKTHAK